MLNCIIIYYNILQDTIGPSETGRSRPQSLARPQSLNPSSAPTPNPQQSEATFNDPKPPNSSDHLP